MTVLTPPVTPTTTQMLRARPCWAVKLQIVPILRRKKIVQFQTAATLSECKEAAGAALVNANHTTTESSDEDMNDVQETVFFVEML